MEGEEMERTIAFVLCAFLLFGCTQPAKTDGLPKEISNKTKSELKANAIAEMKTFKSWDEVVDFLAASEPAFGGYGLVGAGLPLVAKTAADGGAPGGSVRAESYSKTNVQVEGIDEPDIVKTDGRYIYVLDNDYGYYGFGPYSISRIEGIVTIVDAYPAQSMRKVGKITFDGEAVGMFVENDHVVVFGQKEGQMVVPFKAAQCIRCILPPYYISSTSFLRVYDVSDKENPKLVKEIKVKGRYVDARLKDGKVYAFFVDYPTYSNPVPFYEVDGKAKEVEPQKVSYFDIPSRSYTYRQIISLDLKDMQKEETYRIFVTSEGQTMYVSDENIYFAGVEYSFYAREEKVMEEMIYERLSGEQRKELEEIEKGEVPQWKKEAQKRKKIEEFWQKMAQAMNKAQLEEFQKEYDRRISKIQYIPPEEKTRIYKISLSDFAPVAAGEVPGNLLNQFAMDEKDGYLRVATTRQQANGMTSSGIYVLDKEMKLVGKTDKIAPGETIYAVRFMGNKAYLVTFKRIDPFFVIDLSNPSAPKVEGKLKIPGYSTYLHPYDEGHVIGIGHEAVEAKEGDFAWQQGIKLSLYDVRNPENPVEVAKFQVGDRGTTSYALNDHKAFLFDKNKSLLVIPILVAEIDRKKYAEPVPPHAYGEYVFQGAYVFRLTAEEGFVLLGRISHADKEEMLKSGEYFISRAEVKRSIYMDDYLYTISQEFVKANRLPSLDEISYAKIKEGG
ncbi:MAG: beta-propeller domain-containing protein [Candidatus Micrarchaeota archaeon]|nr:beta-propeller domain-containing protein [Candidatus Micrarchaeota archaeon]